MRNKLCMTQEDLKCWANEDDLFNEIERFLEALSKVDQKYFFYKIEDPDLLKLVGNDMPTNTHLERVFAYELYHQWANILGPNNQWTLNAEIEKNISLFYNCQEGEQQSKHKYPDLVLHKGQGLNEQLIVCEIKRKLDKPHTLDDLDKLSKFTSGKGGLSRYKCGVFLLINNTVDDFIEKIQITNDELESDKILCVFANVVEDKVNICYNSLAALNNNKTIRI